MPPAVPPASAASARPAPPSRTAATVSAANCEKPDYPSASRRMEEEGTVSLRFLVGVDGKVIQSEVEKSSGFKRLDEAARAGLSKCRFQPATVDGKPEQAWASMKYTWRLE
jgi:protein TonB